MEVCQTGASLAIENIQGCNPEVGVILRRGFGGFRENVKIGLINIQL